MFPTNWPQDCPPIEAVDASGTVYRLVHSNPPSVADLRTHFETGKMPKGPPCMRCGLSVYRVPEDAFNQQRLYPKLGDKIAVGELRPEHGKTLLTDGKQPTHTTWWPYEGVDRASLFAVIEDIA